MKVIQLKRTYIASRPVLSVIKCMLKLVTSKETRLIKKSNICYLKSDSNYCEVHLVDGSMICCSVTLKSIYERINMSCFIRPHASYVINLAHINYFEFGSHEITLCNGKVIPIARSRKAEIKEEMDRWFD